jgi:hypothetical protein
MHKFGVHGVKFFVHFKKFQLLEHIYYTNMMWSHIYDTRADEVICVVEMVPKWHSKNALEFTFPHGNPCPPYVNACSHVFRRSPCLTWEQGLGLEALGL